MKKLKNIVILMVTGFIAIASITYYSNTVKASEFENKEEYWTATCSQYITDDSLREKCNQYKEYLKQKQEEFKNQSSSLQSDIDKLSGNLAELGELAYSYKDQIVNTEQEIANIQAQVVEMDNSINDVEVKIVEQEEKVAARKEGIKKRMIDIQYSLNSNEYINFIMSSEDLIDFVQRSESIGMITNHDNEKMKELIQDIEELDTRKEELSRIQDMQKTQQAMLNQKKSELATKYEESEKVLATLEEQKASLLSQQTSANASASDYAGLVPTEAAPPLVAPPVTPNPPEGSNEENGNGEGGAVPSNPTVDGLGWPRNFYSEYYSSPYNVISNVNLTGQCTWYCFGRAAEVNGPAYRNLIPTGHAGTWAANSSLPVGSTPRANSIIVWNFGAYGHVAFVEQYSDGYIVISEGNVGAPNGGLGYGTSLETAIYYTQVSPAMTYDELVRQRGTPVGFIYL